jgi:hypothetical protein
MLKASPLTAVAVAAREAYGFWIPDMFRLLIRFAISFACSRNSLLSRRSGPLREPLDGLLPALSVWFNFKFEFEVEIVFCNRFCFPILWV